MKKKVQLVLGSGGARGIAHAGVIQMLLQDGYEIVEVIGCSSGAVIGGMYCAGFLPQYIEWLLKQSKTDIYRLYDVTFSRQGFLKGEKFFAVLEQIAGKHLIENLPIPFVALATDMLTRTEVHFTKGDLYKALRASSGMPGVFTPITENERLFVDGGVLNPLPVNLVNRREDAIVVAVSLSGAFIKEAVIEEGPEASNTQLTTVESQALLDKIKRLFNYTPAAAKKSRANELANLTMFELLNAAYDATLDRLVDVSLQISPADILIEIPRNVCSTFEFYRAAELINAGKTAYAHAMTKRGLGYPNAGH